MKYFMDQEISKMFDLKTKEAQIVPWEIIDLIDKNYIDRVS